MSPVRVETLTIGRLAKAAEVGVETIRYYQERALLPIPESKGSYRQYPVAIVGRIRFIKRAQDLGFSLDEIAGLLTLQDGTDRKSIRAIAAARVEQIEAKLADLQRMRRTLRHLLHECEHSKANMPCPIIETIASEPH
jgi:Hg(II)-responsive transcriptional regulator